VHGGVGFVHAGWVSIRMIATQRRLSIIVVAYDGHEYQRWDMLILPCAKCAATVALRLW
jgi:hypothetical protein